MSSEIKADKWSPASGTSATIGDSGDTYTVPSGANFTVTDELKTNKISPASGTAFTLGDSGDTFTVPSGVTFANSGTATGFGGTNTPNFRATLSATTGNLSASTFTKISPNVEAYDSNNAYTGGTFTVPSGEGGLYHIYGTAYFLAASVQRPTLAFFKNGSRVFTRSPFDENIDVCGYQEVRIDATLNLDATNTVELYVFTSITGIAIYGDANLQNNPASFGAYKLIS